MSSSNYFRSWIDRPHLDPNTRLLTEEYQRGITEFMGLVHRQPEAKTVTKFGIIMGKLIMNMVVLANLSQRLAKELNEDGVENVTLSSSVFTGTQNGVRIKSWARPSTGFVKNVFFQDLIMKNVQNPIIIDQKYCPDHQGCLTEHSGVKISQVTYKNIQGTSATKQAMKLVCSKSNPCTDITLQDIKLTYKKGTPATSYCFNALGTSLGVIQPISCLNQ
ncbi:hypothetical protein F2Q70_00038019 [Brassica cretica]|uniref:Polygalacturonase n=1 Tax=Brassica cretica TaxID=69181 RepID=A0A8S9K433_BRACR|nr:hypothetical protein F2Q70_00038019 [Brassica cretica]